MKNIMCRIRDWRHERRIAAAGRAYDKARYELAAKSVIVAAEKSVLVALWNAYVDLINARSTSQVERMERRMGLR